MKSLVGELTENEKWSIKGTLMGECWHRDCCLSDYKGHKRCGKSEFVRELRWYSKKLIEVVGNGTSILNTTLQMYLVHTV